MEPDAPSERSWTDSLGFDAAARVLGDLEATESVSRRIGDYLVLKRLGGGGGGEVFLVVREGADRPLALKLLRGRLGEGRAARRVWRELDILGQIRQPFTPQLLDHGRHEDHLFLVTEYIDGESVTDYATHRKLDRKARVNLLADVADAVQSLHEHGVIHRDIKPSNVLVTGRGQPVVIDLGVATLLAADVTETLTHDGVPVGSPAFMSPEQARGDHADVSTRSDVYGLGAVAFVLLTGETPHVMDGSLSDAIRRVSGEPPRDPRVLDPSLPRPLAAVLRKAAAERAADRYASAGALGMDLRRWARGEPVDAGETPMSQRFARMVARHPVAATFAACLGVALLTLVATFASVWWLNVQPYGLRLDRAQRSWVHLVSRADGILHTWDAGHPGGIVSAEIVDRDAGLGGGRIAVLAFDMHPRPEYDNFLCAFDLGEPDEPLWSSGAGPPDLVMPEPISTNNGERFRVRTVAVHDVFDESPGAEIVVVHRLVTWSAVVVRIHALDGRVLFEFWHDGAIFDVEWDPASRRLIFCGYNSEALWAQRGHASPEAMPRPIVVFAVRPEYERIHKAWVHTPGGLGTYAADWYVCLDPPDLVSAVAGTAAVLDLATVRPGRLQLHIAPTDEPYALMLLLDPAGNLIERIAGDTYQSQEGLPDPADISLQTLPPIVR